MSFWMAIRLMKGNKGRILFPFIGIMMGLTSLIAIFSLGEGGRSSIEQDLSLISRNSLTLRGEVSSKEISLIEGLPMVAWVSVLSGAIDTPSMVLVPSTNKALNELMESRLKGNEILLDSSREKDYQIGDSLNINLGNRREKFLVKGFFDKKMLGSLKSSTGRYGIIPITTYERVSGSRRYNNLKINLYGEEDQETSQRVILQRLTNSTRKKYIIDGNSDVYGRVEKIRKTLALFLTAMCGVALLMGGFGMSSVMGSTVREYTTNIGILRAYGVSKDIIMEMFLCVALLIAGSAGLLGSLVGTLISMGVGKFIGIPPIFKPSHYIIIICVSLIFGIIFGMLPAKKASQMNPIDALRKS